MPKYRTYLGTTASVPRRITSAESCADDSVALDFVQIELDVGAALADATSVAST